ncbi:Npt1/Npt2 family nucleotide transporter [Candidatus Palauibacter sp.]|uniref:Npt1/Npt2 family nucleotide transporter n=1 Tax=Candidatus Palauibacter sp. TaxID=3101350 RepID=UPI003AF28D63
MNSRQDRSHPGLRGALARRPGAGKLLAMMGLGALVLFVIGILRPLRSAFALSGLAVGDFYQVYFVSAAVVVVAPIYNYLSDRISWRRLIPATAAFFAVSMLAFRLLYQEDAAWFGLVFYGWYDLLAASLVTQFYMATQIFYNARDAKRAYPVVIAAGSAGATLGALTHVLVPEGGGSENLLLVAGAALVVLAAGIAAVWAREAPEPPVEARPGDPELEGSELRRMAAHPQVRLIAATVLLTIVVKQFIDYQYNTLTREVFTDLGAIAGFLALVDVLTQWMPILVLLALRPILRRWGAGVAVIIFPTAMILATGALAAAVWLSTAALAVAVGARTMEKMFRYSAERTGREILYVPVPEDIKLKAKSYIDVAIEKGLGKTLSGALIAIPSLALASISLTGRLVILGVLGLGFAALLLVAFLKVRREYVTSLAQSFEGRFASLRGTFVSMADAGAMDLARDALKDERPLKVTFAFDLLRGATPDDIATLSPELYRLLEHENHDLRAEALDALLRAPSLMDEDAVRARLEDEDPRVRQAAVRLLARKAGRAPRDILLPLLDSKSTQVRAATLACLLNDFGPARAARITTPRFERLLSRRTSGSLDDAGAFELAVAAGLVPGHPAVEDIVLELVAHPDDEVAAAAVRSAARLPHEALVQTGIAALASPRTRAAARDGLARRGQEIVTPLLEALSDPASDPWVRRGVASVLGDIATPATVDALITAYLLPETEQALDDQALVSLHRLRTSHDHLTFPDHRVLQAVEREVRASERYARAEAALRDRGDSVPGTLLLRALHEARRDRRASVFRWLGLVYPEQSMRRSYLALESGQPRRRANALEWIESTVGHRIFSQLEPVLAAELADEVRREPGDVLRELWDDEDIWIGRCALWTSFESERESLAARLDGFVSSDAELEDLSRRLAHDSAAGRSATEEGTEEGEEMELIEKVFRLQTVDLLSGVDSRQLALLASIAREVDAREDAVFIRKGEPTDALYLVIRGEVSLEGVGDGSVSLTDGQAFGTWALIDEQPSLVEARAVRPTRVLRITREDFRDLLIDHPELGLDLLRGFASRVRGLAMT